MQVLTKSTIWKNTKIESCSASTKTEDVPEKVHQQWKLCFVFIILNFMH